MKLLQCVTDSPYILWQLYIQMLNFRDFGYEKDAVILVNTLKPSEGMKAFQKWTKAQVVFIEDTRQSQEYFSSFRPHLIKKYIATLGRDIDSFFYHDQDIIFRRFVDISSLAEGLHNYVASEARSYLETKYLNIFPKYTHLQDMCDIVGISRGVVEANERFGNIGGAQYVIKNTGYDFWDKVERDSEAIYKKLKADTRQDAEVGEYFIQIWTADMWALLYNLYLHGSVRTHKDIDFCWPWERPENPKPIFHNAGIDAQNCRVTGTDIKQFFNKHDYDGPESPFNYEHDIRKDIVQQEYLAYFKRAELAMPTFMKKMRILGVFCTTNRINKELLSTVLSKIKAAVDNTQTANVEVVTCSWEPIAANPFTALITPFKVASHINYLLQIRQIMATYPNTDIICILEHDVLYPDNYFDFVIENWDRARYGIYNMNYIGMNDSGYLNVRQRDCPMSMCSAARFYFDHHIRKKIDEALDKLSSANTSVYVEPPVEDMKKIPFTGIKPCIHVNMNERGDWGTGAQGKNHHFTNHCEVCYEQESAGVTSDEYWGDYKNLLPHRE